MGLELEFESVFFSEEFSGCSFEFMVCPDELSPLDCWSPFPLFLDWDGLFRSFSAFGFDLPALELGSCRGCSEGSPSDSFGVDFSLLSEVDSGGTILIRRGELIV